MRKWRIEDSEELYNIPGWGRNYFSVNEKGHIIVTPRSGYASVDLKEVMDELQVRDVPPCTIALPGYPRQPYRKNIKLFPPSLGAI